MCGRACRRVSTPTVAAALPAAGVTALEIVESLELLRRKALLFVGAAGGVGSFATQLAAHAGAQVIAVARAGAAERMRAYGAAETLDHTAVSVPGAVPRTHPDGIDVLVNVASDADGYATLASLVRPGGTALTTRYLAEPQRPRRRKDGHHPLSNETTDLGVGPVAKARSSVELRRRSEPRRNPQDNRVTRSVKHGHRPDHAISDRDDRNHRSRP